jgi:hypothetical protein
MVKDKFQRVASTILSYGILWGIWNVRNDLVFKDKKPNWNKLFDIVLHRLALWFNLHVLNLKITSWIILKENPIGGL